MSVFLLKEIQVIEDHQGNGDLIGKGIEAFDKGLIHEFQNAKQVAQSHIDD